ncbi:MAG: Ni/Fe hydrogenase subunit alpha [Bacillota bacterium]
MSGSTPANDETRSIHVAAMARVEGEGALHVTMRQGKVEEVRLEIYEPPRFFEALLRGRDFREVPDIVARICGICPVAYQMSACHAIEKALDVSGQIDPAIITMRDLLYCGEWIESHVLHIFLLHLPDFLGYESAISMAKDHGDLVKRALQVKKLGNEIIALLGGRSVHPVGACIGGFYSLPETDRCRQLLPTLRTRLDEMCELTLFLARKLTFPDFDRDYEFVALQPAGEYPMNRGPIVSSRGLRIEQEQFLQVFEEQQVPYSTALRAIIKGRGAYCVGPLARLNLNAASLHSRAAELLQEICTIIQRDLPWRNSFLSLLARCVETVHALAVAGDILQNYTQPKRSRVPVEACAGTGAAATEAPRGVLWHQYRIGADGSIVSARIVPPTSQNQYQIENDLRVLAEQIISLPDEQAQLRCEQLIRNYDPCISCATHFLKFDRRWK